MKKVVVLVSALLAAGNVAAETQQGSFMLGGALGFDASNFADEIEDELGAGFDVEDDGSAIGPDIYLGYAFGGASSIRMGYRTFGEQSGEVSFGGASVGDYSVEVDGLYFAGDLMLPLSDTAFVGGTLGLQNWDGESTTRTAMGTLKGKSDGRDFFYGVRGKFLFNEKSTGLVVGYTLYSFEDEAGDELEYDSFSIGLEGYFR